MDVQKLASEIVIGLNIAYERSLPLPAVETVALVIREHIAAQQGVERIGYQTAIIPCPHCGVNVTIDSDSFIANR